MEDFHIGMLNSFIILCNVLQVPNPDNSGRLMETYYDLQIIKAHIEPTQEFPFLDNQHTQLGMVNHKAIVRWQNFNKFNRFARVLHEYLAPDQSVVHAVYKIHTVKEITSKHRFVEFQMEFLRNE